MAASAEDGLAIGVGPSHVIETKRGEGYIDVVMKATVGAVVVVLLLAVPKPVVAASAVELSFVGPSGETARISRARLLLAAWGVAERTELVGNSSRLRIDSSTRPDWATKFGDFRMYLYVEADGYAPLLSEAFDWPGYGGPRLPSNSVATKLDFRNGRSVALLDSKAVTMTVTLRHPIRRVIHIIDEGGRAVSDVEMKAAVFWSASNHCGFPAGIEPLTSGATSPEGTVEVQDADAQYIFLLKTSDAAFIGTNGAYEDSLTMRLTRPTTTVHVGKYRKRAITFNVVNKGAPVSGAQLWSSPVADVCEGTSQLATTDQRGRLTFQWSYPAPSELWLCYQGEDVWEGTAPAESSRGAVRIDLSATTTQGGYGCPQ